MAVADILLLHGRIDVLRNNPGYAGMGGAVELPEAEWDHLLNLNLKGVFLACKHVLPIVLRQGKGASSTSPASRRSDGPGIPTPLTVRQRQE